MGDQVEFRVLGQLDVLVGGEPVRLGGPRPRAVLGVLLVHAGKPVSADRLIEQVWGAEPPATATTALQVHISALRKVLGERVITTSSGYRLNVAQGELDADRFEDLVSVGDLAAALDLWRGEPYAGVPAGPDVDAARQRLSELRLSTMEDRLDAELTLGRHAEVVSELAGLVVDHPLRERVAALYMLALHRTGRGGDALAAYQALRERLAAQLGTEPGTEISLLAKAIDRGDPTLDTPPAIARPASRFIGRRRELEELAGQLGESRLLTVTGPGGAGKTRLALELARDTTADHPDGVHIVELASSAPGSSIIERVAGVLDVRVASAETLAARLRGDRALLVLDNCEHVVDSAARLSAGLLTQCAGLRILATSREPLGVPGERVWPLGGLAVPEPDDSVAVAARSEAVRLLADRAAAAQPGFLVHAGNVAVAAGLCRRLDGLPLAIELAAAQLRSLSLDEVASRLDLGDDRAPERHRTMRTAIDWSHHLLSAEERTAFHRLAVFVGGCRADAAEKVTGAQQYLLARLVDQSLLVVESHPDGTRYRMLELIREYAAERLTESGEAAELRRRHSAWYADLAEHAPLPGGTEHAAVLRGLDADVANLRSAVDWCLDAGANPERALRIAAPLWWYWWERGLMSDGRLWLRRALAASGPQPSPLRGSALRAAAALARNSGDFAEAVLLGEQCLATYRGLRDPGGMIIALNGLSITDISRRDYLAAVRHASEAEQLAAQAGDVPRRSAALNNMSIALILLDRLDEARAAIFQALEGYRATGLRRGEADALANLGDAAERSGDAAGARALYLESLAVYQELDFAEGKVEILEALGRLEVAGGLPAQGLRLLTVAGRERARLGAPGYTPDKVDRVRSALAEASSALGATAAGVIDSARDVPLNSVVTRLLDL